VTRPRSEGGVLEKKGMVEVISGLGTDGRVIPCDIRMGVRVTVEAETDYVKNCFEEYNAHTDPSGRHFTLYKHWHLIGLELGFSVASVALRGEHTGAASRWNADVVATANRDLQPGEVLDGEGGYCVWGKLLPATTSAAMGGWTPRRVPARCGARWNNSFGHEKGARGAPASRHAEPGSDARRVAAQLHQPLAGVLGRGEAGDAGEDRQRHDQGQGKRDKAGAAGGGHGGLLCGGFGVAMDESSASAATSSSDVR
jgi:hypothetical protein